jgi:RNA polymerase subunit RPABC4/transcription elongation factor Spt4
MSNNASANGYTRCHNCSEVYDVDKDSCPNCGTPNTTKVVNEGSMISESVEPVFNIND